MVQSIWGRVWRFLKKLKIKLPFVVVVQSLSPVQHIATPWTAACQAFLSFIISWSLLKLMSIESVMQSNSLVLSCPLLLLPSIFPSIRIFSNELALRISLSKYWNFSFNINPSNEYSWLISFRIDWFDFFVVQGALKSLLQHYSLKALILQCSAFFMVQLPHPYMTNGKTIALTRWTFASKVMSLLFNTLSRLVIAFLPRSRSVQFSCSVVSDSLRPYELQHARPPCPSPTPGVYSNSCLSSQCCHPAISFSVTHFFSCPQSLPASESFPKSQLFA